MTAKLPFIAPPATIQWHLPNGAWPTIQPADILIVQRKGIVGDFVRFGAWIRPLNRPYSWATHNAFADTSLTVIQELGRGSVQTPLSDLDPCLVAIVRIKATPAQKASAIAFETWTLNSAYDWLSIVGDGVDDITGLHVAIATYGTSVCSSSVGRAAERMGLIPDRVSPAIQPPDMARYWGIESTHVSVLLAAHKASLIKGAS